MRPKYLEIEAQAQESTFWDINEESSMKRKFFQERTTNLLNKKK